MLRPVLDPVLSREILARYTTFAGSVGAPAPMEHLAPAGQAVPPRYETYVENLYEVTHLLRKNTVLNLQWDLRFVALRLAGAIEQAGRTQTRRVQMLERQVTLLQNEAGRLRAAAHAPQPAKAVGGQDLRPPQGLTVIETARQAANAPLPVAEPVPPVPTPAPRVLAQPVAPVQTGEEPLPAAEQRPGPVHGQSVGQTPTHPQTPEKTTSSHSHSAQSEPATASRASGISHLAPATPARPAVSTASAATPAPTAMQAAQPTAAAVETPEKVAVPQAVLPGTPPPVPTPADRVLAQPAVPGQSGQLSQPTTGHSPGSVRGQGAERPSARPQTSGNAAPPAPTPAQRPAVSAASAVTPSDSLRQPTAPMSRPQHPTVGSVEAAQRRTDPSATSSVAAPRQPSRPTRVPLGHIEPAEGEAEPAPLSDPRPGRLQRPAPASRVLRQDSPERASQRQQQNDPRGISTSAPVVANTGVATAPRAAVPPAQPAGTATHSVVQPPAGNFSRQGEAISVQGAIHPAAQSPAAGALPTGQGQTISTARRDPEGVQPVQRVHADPPTVPSAQPTEDRPAYPSRGTAQQNPPYMPSNAVPAASAKRVPSGKNAPVPASPAARTSGSVPIGPSQPTPRHTPPMAGPASLVYPTRTSAISGEGPISSPAGKPAAGVRIDGKADHVSLTTATSVTVPAVSPSPPPAAPAPLVHATGPVASSQHPTPPQGAATRSQGRTSPAGMATGKAAGTLSGTAPTRPFPTLPAFAAVPKIAAFTPASYRTALSGGAAQGGISLQASGEQTPQHSARPAVLTGAASAGPAAAVEMPALQEATVTPTPQKTPAPRQAVPTGGPAPMELRRTQTPATPGPAFAASWESSDIQTVRRTRTTHREVHQEAPSTVTVRLPNQPAAQPVPAALGPAEVERLAEKVYRQIEERLRSEKMRRGM